MNAEITSLRLSSLPFDQRLITVSTGEVRVPPSYRDREHSSTVANIIELAPREEPLGVPVEPPATEFLPAEALDHGVMSQADAQNPIV